MKRPSLDSGQLRKATALVPLVCLSGAWTASLAVSSAGATPGAAELVQPPTEAIEAPASWSHPEAVVPVQAAGWARGRTAPAVSSNAIPTVALAAYQRAALVMDGADPDCNVPWTVLAAIGRIESDHGRYGGSLLQPNGVSRPGIYGVPLTGAQGTQRIADTDAGAYDGDRRFDRAVGPMQFIPSTWSVVGVDGDGDKQRNPQDIDDASLAAAVYLCSGKDDLSTDRGVDAAVFRYNHSRDYVAMVTSVAAAYASGDYTAVPAAAYAPVFLGDAQADSVRALALADHTEQAKPAKPQHAGAQPPAPAPATAHAPGSQPSAGDDKPSTNPVEHLVKSAPEAVQDTVDDGLGLINGLLESVGLGALIGDLLPETP